MFGSLLASLPIRIEEGTKFIKAVQKEFAELVSARVAEASSRGNQQH